MKKYLWAREKFHCIQSTLVISNSQGDLESVRDNEKLEITRIDCTFILGIGTEKFVMYSTYNIIIE